MSSAKADALSRTQMQPVKQAISEAEERFEHMRRTAGFFLAPALFLAIYFWPMPGLSPQAHAMAAVMAFTITCWITECVPIPVASMLGPTLAVVLGVATAREAYTAMADPTVLLFLGGFLLAKAMEVHGLDRRFALRILSLGSISRTSSMILLGVGGVTGFLSMWLSNTATAAMMFPITLGVLTALKRIITTMHGREIDNSKYQTGMLLTIAYTASIGGMATPIGTPPNMITIGLIEKATGVRIVFFQWMMLALPIALLMFLVLWLYFNWRCPSAQKDLKGAASFIAAERKAQGSWKRGEINALIAFLVAVALWVTPGFIALFGGGTGSPLYKSYQAIFPEASVAIIAASLLFFLPVDFKKREFTLNWKQAVHIDWGTLLLFGGGLSLGEMMFKTGLAGAIGKGLVTITGAHTLVAITALALGLAILLTETTSNTAAATMVVPIVIGIASAAGVNPIPPAVAVALGASMAFVLPVSTPPNAIVYGSGMVPITQMVKYGLLLDIIGYLIVLAGVLVLTPLVGL
ncbi:SLC13 family permease [Desulfofundulus thermocisternus]|uniref:SLC13 family permease n=1 Tax=Desulfofundulus thermocisternus TaxID=42471 RepID=UPI001A98E89E|nr:DASS family sodium-coupled anion symporter [Desulfofundulus thermocisternus]